MSQLAKFEAIVRDAIVIQRKMKEKMLTKGRELERFKVHATVSIV
jgi:hypothetical protein